MIPFDTVAPGIRPREPRNKAADARPNTLPAGFEPWKDRIPALHMEALVVVERANKAAGDTACVVHRTDIASAIGVTPEGAERILARLVEVGAVECRKRVDGSAPLLRAVMTPPASPARKADPAPVAPEPRRRAASVTDARLRAGLVGLRNHEEPAKLDLRDGIVGANPRR